MKKILNHVSMPLVMIMMLSSLLKAQTLPPTFPARWMELLVEKCCSSHITADTSLPPKHKCVQWGDSCKKFHKTIKPFVNHDSLIRKQVLKNWKRY